MKFVFQILLHVPRYRVDAGPVAFFTHGVHPLITLAVGRRERPAVDNQNEYV